MHASYVTVSVSRLITALLLVTSVYSQKVGVKSEIGFACFNSALNWNFNCPNELLPFDCRCSREDFLTTAMSCVAENSSNIRETSDGWWYIRDQCHYWGKRTMSLEEMSEIYLRRRDDLLNASTLNLSTPLTPVPGPIRVPQQLLDSQYEATKDTKYHYNIGNYFGWGIFGYWGLVLMGGVLTNAIRILCPDVYNVFGAGRVTRIRKALTLPALVGKNHHSPRSFSKYFSCFMPTRGQFIIMLGAMILNIAAIVGFIGVKGDSPLSFISQSDRKLHYLANRTGIVAIAQIPFIVLFAARNNPFIPLTGWSYDTFMTYHRWCARFMGIQAVIHAVAIYWSSLAEHVVLFKWHRIHNWRGGNLAAYTVIFMLCCSWRRVRSNFYEFFKMSHVVMFLIFIICMVVHLSDYGWLAWLYTSLAFYGLEYLGRLIRIVMSGAVHKAQFTLAEDEMYRIKVQGNRKWNITPGSFVYVRVLDKDLFWQSHPFSIFQGPEGERDNSIELCCKARMGSTKILVDKLTHQYEKTFVKNVMIEGPYGNGNYVADYDSVLLFAGGVGFTAMYNHASNIIKRLKPGQYMCLIWVVKDCKFITTFEPEVAYLLHQNRDQCNFRIFVTSPCELTLGTVNKIGHNARRTINEKKAGLVFNSPSRATLVEPEAPSSDSSENRSTPSVDMMDDESVHYMPDSCDIVIDGDVPINIDYGRPNIGAEICDFIRTANGSKAVCSCGPPRFVDEIRGGIVSSIMDSDARVDLFEDAFSW